jgi:hypothetical protein
MTAFRSSGAIAANRSTVPCSSARITEPDSSALPSKCSYSDPEATPAAAALNELTDVDDRDPIAGTPWPKHNPARIERISASEEVAA